MGKKSADTYEPVAEPGLLATFLDRQKGNALHWAAPKVEQMRAWGEYGLADSTLRGKIAAGEATRYAKDTADAYGPQVKDAAGRATHAVADQYGRYAPQVAGAVTALAPALGHRVEALNAYLEDLQKQAEKGGKKLSRKARKKAKKQQKVAAKRAEQLKKEAFDKSAAFKKDALAKRDDLLKYAAAQSKDLKKAGAKNAKKARKATQKGGAAAQASLLAGLGAVSAGAGKYAPELEKKLKSAGAYADHRRQELVPAVAQRLADTAGKAGKTAHDVKVPAGVESALVNLTGDKKIVKKLRRAAENAAASTQKEMKRQVRRNKSSSGKGWIVAGMAAAAGAAAFALYRLTKPVEDPWKAPAPGPVTANIPVVEAHADHQAAASDPYARQRAVLDQAAQQGDASVQQQIHSVTR